MLTPYKRNWVLLAGFVGCAGLGTLGLGVEPLRIARAQSSSELQPLANAQQLYLIKLLQGSPQFRVRAQAAISLGLMERSLTARAALKAALRDAHPAVRAAAATSLGRLGDWNDVSVLRKLESDREAPVRDAARASISRLESMIDDAPAELETRTTLAANR